MEIIEILAIITFLIFLIVAVYMTINFYVCDRHLCKPYIDASAYKSEGEQAQALLNSAFGDGMWPLAYLAGALIAGIYMLLFPGQVTLQIFGISFLVSFVVVYFVLMLLAHHYLRPIVDTVDSYIDGTMSSVCMNSPGGVIPPLVNFPL